MQTLTESVVEELTKQAVSILRAYPLQTVILPLFDIESKLSSNFGMATIFTMAAFVTNLGLRRFWNWVRFGNPQNRLQSCFEEGIKTSVGYLRLVILQPYVFALFSIEISGARNWAVAALFYVGVIATNIPLRRFFNWLEVRKAARVQAVA